MTLHNLQFISVPESGARERIREIAANEKDQ